MPKWEVNLFENFSSNLVDTFISFENADGSRRVLQAADQIITVEAGQAAPPTLRLPSGVLHALAEALDQLGVRTDKDAKLQGTIEAMRAHLSDLRQLLKLKG